MRKQHQTQPRKDQHLAAFLDRWQRTNQSSLLEEVTILPCALPQASLGQVVLQTEFLNRVLAAPIIITAITGGTDKAGKINRILAQIAAHHQIGFGLGSQRAMLEDPQLKSTFQVRDVAPDILLLANVGIAQLQELDSARLHRLVDDTGADALAVHLNVAQELVQPEGDRDFTGTWRAIERTIQELSVPVVVKGVGSGIDRHTAARLADTGVAAIDLAGVGGTSWPAMESARTLKFRPEAEAETNDNSLELGELFRDWGIPTGPNILITQDLGVPIIASGGINNGLEGAKAIVLGAHVVGMAGMVLKVLLEDGQDGADAFIGRVIEELRITMFLAGCLNVSQMKKAGKVIGPNLARWQEQMLLYGALTAETTAAATGADPGTDPGTGTGTGTRAGAGAKADD